MKNRCPDKGYSRSNQVYLAPLVQTAQRLHAAGQLIAPARIIKPNLSAYPTTQRRARLKKLASQQHLNSRQAPAVPSAYAESDFADT